MSLEDLELTDLSNELSVRSVVRDILTSQDQNRPKFNYNSVKTLMVRKYGSNAFERVKPVVGTFCVLYDSLYPWFEDNYRSIFCILIVCIV